MTGPSFPPGQPEFRIDEYRNRIPALFVAALIGLKSNGTRAQKAVVDLGVCDVGELQRTGRTTSEALVERYLARIKAFEQAYGSEPGVDAVIALHPETIPQARELDAGRRAGKIRRPVYGVPIFVKDNYAPPTCRRRADRRR